MNILSCQAHPGFCSFTNTGFKYLGAGGKGGPSRTKAIDEVAAKAYISASLATPSITKFLLVSYIASRKGYPPWWNDEDKKAADHVNTNVLPAYFKAKVEADEHLETLTQKRLESGDKAFQAINLRPGTLTDDPPSERVSLGKTTSRKPSLGILTSSSKCCAD